MRGCFVVAAVMLAAAVACLRGDAGFRCASDTSCGAGGACAAGYCAFPDATCPSGQRYGASSGPFSNQCVGQTADAGLADAHPDSMIDGMALAPPTFVSVSEAHFGSSASFSFPASVAPSATRRLLVVSVGIAEKAGTFPQVQTVTYGGIVLTFMQAIVGVPANAGTRSEQWYLIAPPSGTADVAVTLTTEPATVHASAMLFAGVNQVTPIRAMAAGSGEGTSSSVTVASASTDLVESWLGFGGAGIGAAGTGQVIAYIDNVSSANSLDNDAASYLVPGAPSVTMSWTENGAADEWQELAASLQP